MAALPSVDEAFADTPVQPPRLPNSPVRPQGGGDLAGELLPVVRGLERTDAAARRAGVPEGRVVSPAGAVGKYQIMPATARLLGFDPERLSDDDYNETVARAAIEDLIQQHGPDDREAIIAGYNASPRAVSAWKQADRDMAALPEETRHYIERYREMASAEPPAAPVAPPPAPEAGEVPSIDDAFGKVGDTFVRRFDKRLQQSVFRVADAFGYSGAETFGKEPIATPSTALTPETDKWLRDNGVFNDYAKGQADVTRGIFEGLFKGAAAGLAITERAAAAAMAAPLGSIGQMLEELGIVGSGGQRLAGAATDPGAAMVLGPFGEFTALTAQANARRAANLHVDLSEARAGGVLAEGEAGFFGAVPVTPENAQARTQAAQTAGLEIPIPEPVPPDLHTLARRIDPTATERFDALDAEKRAHQDTIRTILAEREASPEVVAAREEIARLAGEPRPVEEITLEAPVPISDEIGGNVFMRPQPEDVPRPVLPEPPSGPVTELPVVERAVFDEASLRAEDARLNQELRGLPRGGRGASDRLAKLSAVERSLADKNITSAERVALLRRRDEILTDTTPEKLRAEAGPLERRRAIQAERETIAERLATFEEGRAKKRAAALSEPKIPVTPEDLQAAQGRGVAERLAAAEARLEAALNAPSPELDAARAALGLSRTEQIRLLPEVLDAYKRAGEMMPLEQMVVDAMVAASEGKGELPSVRQPAGPRVSFAQAQNQEDVFLDKLRTVREAGEAQAPPIVREKVAEQRLAEREQIVREMADELAERRAGLRDKDGAIPSAETLRAQEAAENAVLAKLSNPEVPGDDIAIERAAQRKTVGPPREPGTVRFYHGGVEAPTSGGPRWVSPDFAYARDYRDGATTYYVDLPVGHPMEVAARSWDEIDTGTNAVGTYRNAEFPEDLAQKMKPVGEATVAERVTPPQKPRAGPQLRVIEGTGPTKTRSLSEHVEASAIENELTDTFGELPEYEQVSMFDQAVKAAQFLTEKPDDALAVAMGLKAAPKGILPESVFVAVEKAATSAGDVELLRQLATESRLTTAATTMGQRIRTLGERDRLSPVSAIQEVADARMAALERRNATAVKDTVKEIRATVRQTAPKKADWQHFITSITCAD